MDLDSLFDVSLSERRHLLCVSCSLGGKDKCYEVSILTGTYKLISLIIRTLSSYSDLALDCPGHVSFSLQFDFVIEASDSIYLFFPLISGVGWNFIFPFELDMSLLVT